MTDTIVTNDTMTPQAYSPRDISEIEEWGIRKWFCMVDLEQALDTFRVVEGILQARKEAQPVLKAPRKQRADKGQSRPHREPDPFDREQEQMRK